VYFRVDSAGLDRFQVRRLSLDAPSQVTNIIEHWKIDGSLRSVNIRPDGNAAVIGIAKNGVEDLWTLNLDGSAQRQITADGFFDKDPKWLGTSDRVVFQSNRGGQMDLWEINVQTKELTGLTTDAAEDVVESTSADGRIISFLRLSKDANLWSFSANAAEQLTQDSLSDYSPVLSGDGRTIAFQRSQPTPSRGYTILDAKVFVSPFDGRPVIDAREHGDGFAPDLSSDGKWLAYMQVSDLPARMKVFVRDLRAGATSEVTRSGGLPGLSTTPVDWTTRLTAWTRTGADLFFVDVEQEVYVLKRYRAGQPKPGPVLARSSGTIREATIRDLHVSPTTGKLAFIASSRDRVTLNELDPETEVVREIAVFGRAELGQGFNGLGWLDGRFVLLRNTQRHDDRTYDVEVLLVGATGGVTRAGLISHAASATARIHSGRRALYVMRVEQGASNVYAFAIDTGQVTPMTQNRLPGVTFSGFYPAGPNGVIGVREERRDDIWLIQEVTTPRTGNQAGR
jgi:Tol biopolymer transport system component